MKYIERFGLEIVNFSLQFKQEKLTKYVDKMHFFIKNTFFGFN